MSAPTRAPSTGAWAVEKTVLTLAAITVALLGLVHGTGWLLAAATGRRPPTLSPSAAVGMLHGHPYAPGIPVPAHAAAIAIALTGAATVAWWARHRHAHHRESPANRTRELAARPGWATSAAVGRATSERTLFDQARLLRPALTRPRPEDIGYLLGHANGTPVWASVERSVLVIGPPGSGKGLHLAINAILDAPGPVITTSTKPDNLTATITTRADRGPVAVFDPQGMLPTGFEHLACWDLIAGCEDPVRAATRAEALAANTGIGDGDHNQIWRIHAQTVIETVLHAAALNGHTANDAYRWMQNEHTLDTPLRILEQHPDACATWDDRLRGTAGNPDPRFVGSVISVVAAAIAPLALPTVRDALTPSATRPTVTAEQVLDAEMTVYCLATDRGAGASAGLVSALIEDLAYVARRRAARSPNGRLDPPLLFLLDECANVAPIPSLPALLADGRGQSLTVMPIFQTLAQVRSRYGDQDAATIFSASQIKLILGGTDDPDDCRDLSTLIGERDDWYTTTNRSAHALAIDTGATTSAAVRKVPILPPDQIRAIPFGTAVMLQSQLDPFPLQLRPWTARPDTHHLRRQRADVEHALTRRVEPPARRPEPKPRRVRSDRTSTHDDGNGR